MLHRTGTLVALFAYSSFALFNAGMINCAYASQNYTGETQQQASNKIVGKVTDMADAAGYTYVEVDTGKEKVWAAATTTPLKIGDNIKFEIIRDRLHFFDGNGNRV